jgi:thioredoxin-like negative regulator of GroEL
VYEAAAQQYGSQITFAKADVSAGAQASAAQYGLQAVPTLLFLKNGQVSNKIEGGMDAQDFNREIASFLGAPAAYLPAPSQAPQMVVTQGYSGKQILGAIALSALIAGTGYLIYKSS